MSSHSASLRLKGRPSRRVLAPGTATAVAFFGSLIGLITAAALIGFGQNLWLALSFYLFAGPLVTLLWATALAHLNERALARPRQNARTWTYPTDLDRRFRRV